MLEVGARHTDSIAHGLERVLFGGPIALKGNLCRKSLARGDELIRSVHLFSKQPIIVFHLGSLTPAIRTKLEVSGGGG